MNEKIKKYPKTDLYEVVDTIGVPHAYTIGADHVADAADNHGGRLGEETMRKIQCAHRGCRLTFDQHEKALVVKCKTDLKDERLREYLKSIAEMCSNDGFVGFVFIDGKQEKDPTCVFCDTGEPHEH